MVPVFRGKKWLSRGGLIADANREILADATSKVGRSGSHHKAPSAVIFLAIRRQSSKKAPDATPTPNSNRFFKETMRGKP